MVQPATQTIRVLSPDHERCITLAFSVNMLNQQVAV